MITAAFSGIFFPLVGISRLIIQPTYKAFIHVLYLPFLRYLEHHSNTVKVNPHLLPKNCTTNFSIAAKKPCSTSKNADFRQNLVKRKKNWLYNKPERVRIFLWLFWAQLWQETESTSCSRRWKHRVWAAGNWRGCPPIEWQSIRFCVSKIYNQEIRVAWGTRYRYRT
jgi:hypothetical protein